MANTFANSGQLGLAIPVGMDTGVATASLLDSAFVYGVSGDVIGIMFCSPVTQTNGSLLMYAMHDTTTGTPSYTSELRAGAAAGDEYRVPLIGGTATATSDVVTSPTDDDWALFTFTGATLVRGLHYWLCLYNSSADPANHNGEWYTRGALDANPYSGGSQTYSAMRLNVYTDGFAVAKNFDTTNVPPVVLKFDDGTIVGMPYVGTEAHANDTNHRGNRLTIPGSVVIDAITFPSGTANCDEYGIYTTDGTSVSTQVPDEAGEKYMGRIPVATLSAGVTYDYVMGLASASTAGNIYNMVEASVDVPADVKAARPCSYVDGTPGAMTERTDAIMGMMIFIQDIPLNYAPASTESRLEGTIQRWNGQDGDHVSITTAPEGSTFHAVDTGRRYIFHGGGWAEDLRRIYIAEHV